MLNLLIIHLGKAFVIVVVSENVLDAKSKCLYGVASWEERAQKLLEIFRIEFGPAKFTKFLNTWSRDIQFPKGGHYLLQHFLTLQKSPFPSTNC